nr:unnamed protein product [Callosobruchus chinensis]
MASKYVIKLYNIVAFFKDEENAFESGHVTSLVSDADIHPIRGKVHASRICPRGQLRCHHMAALLLFARDNISVTDKECMWSKPKQEKDPAAKKISDLYPPKDHRSTTRNLTDEKIKQFKDKLSVFDGSVGFSWLLSEEIDQDENNGDQKIVNIEDVIFHEDYVKEQYITQIAQQTVGQQCNPKWLLLRKNRLTASNFAAVLFACRRQRFPQSLFKRLLGTYNMEHIKAIQWGNIHEKKGIQSLEESLNVKVAGTGLWLH